MELSFGVSAIQGSTLMFDPTMIGCEGVRLGGSGAGAGVGATQDVSGVDFSNHMNIDATRRTPEAASVGSAAVAHAGHVGDVADRRVTGGLDFLGIGEQRDAVVRELQSLRSSSDADGFDPKIRELEASFTSLFNLQLQVQDMSLRAEMASKLAEHATSSTKTVLQTQT